MAVLTRVVLIDDLTGGNADQTVRFGLDGALYEIDLCDENAAVLRRKLARYVENARVVDAGDEPVRSRRQLRTANKPTVDEGVQRSKIRDWAREKRGSIGSGAQ